MSKSHTFAVPQNRDLGPVVVLVYPSGPGGARQLWDTYFADMQYGKSFNELDLSEYAEDDLLVISTRDEALEILCACVGDRVYKGHIRGAANVWSAAAACMKVGFLTDSEIEEFNEEENRNELLRAGLEYLLDEPTRWEAALECLRMGMTGEEVRKEIEGD